MTPQEKREARMEQNFWAWIFVLGVVAVIGLIVGMLKAVGVL